MGDTTAKAGILGLARRLAREPVRGRAAQATLFLASDDVGMTGQHGLVAAGIAQQSVIACSAPAPVPGTGTVPRHRLQANDRLRRPAGPAPPGGTR